MKRSAIAICAYAAAFNLIIGPAFIIGALASGGERDPMLAVLCMAPLFIGVFILRRIIQTETREDVYAGVVRAMMHRPVLVKLLVANDHLVGVNIESMPTPETMH